MKVARTGHSPIWLTVVVAVSVGVPAVAEEAWLIGNWNYESNFEFQIQRGETTARQIGSVSSTKRGRLIEFRPIKGGHGNSGALRGLVRGPGDIVWNFVYDRQGAGGSADACNGGTERPAEVALDPVRQTMRVRVPWFRGGRCEAPTPWISTLYRY